MARGFEPPSESEDSCQESTVAANIVVPQQSLDGASNGSAPVQYPDHLYASGGSGDSNSRLSAAPMQTAQGARQYISSVLTSSTATLQLGGSQSERPTLEETENVAAMMFREFVTQHVPADQDTALVEEATNILSSTTTSAFSFDGYNDPGYAIFGRDLRRIAESLENSPERRQVREKADQVDIEHMDADQFRSLLLELFCSGFSRERIVVLFFFCTDLAIRGLTYGTTKYFTTFINWSLAFIVEKVCSWVHEQGGWGVVLYDYVPRAVLTIAGVLSIVALSVFIKKNL